MIISVTWANHYSAIKNMREPELYRDFDLIAIDGLFLKYLLQSKKSRTSADLTLPIILNSKNLTVGLVGGRPQEQELILSKFGKEFPLASILFQMDGYSGLDLNKLRKLLQIYSPDIVIFGLGPLIQEEVIIKVQLNLKLKKEKNIVFISCGGWLDQLQEKNYYPSFAYKLRINWLIRLIREPRRLWKRYTVFAISAFLKRKEIRDFFEVLPGYKSLEKNPDNITQILIQYLK